MVWVVVRCGKSVVCVFGIHVVLRLQELFVALFDGIGVRVFPCQRLYDL